MTLHSKLFETLETIQEVFYLFFDEGMEFSITTTQIGDYWIQIDHSDNEHELFFAALIRGQGEVEEMHYAEENRELAVLAADFLSSILDKEVMLQKPVEYEVA